MKSRMTSKKKKIGENRTMDKPLRMSQSVKTMGNKNKTAAINPVIGLEYMNAMDISDHDIFHKTTIDQDVSLARTKDSTALGAPSPYND